MHLYRGTGVRLVADIASGRVVHALTRRSEHACGGLILGGDLVWRGGQWLARPTESRDSVVKKAKNFDELVRHTYRVLLTRGLQGCAVLSTDAETSAFLRGLLPLSPYSRKTPNTERSPR